MRVLVTGATGFLGSWVARELLARGHAVRALVRLASRLDNLGGLAVERASGDALDPPSVERALAGCDAVVHAAGAVDWSAPRERILAVNHRAVEVVLGAALAAGVRRAAAISSVAALGGTRRPALLDESSPSRAEELSIGYMVSKHRGERAALELIRRGLPAVVLRPAVLLGPGDVYGSSASTVLALARRRFPVYVSGGASFCDVRDVARGCAEALERGRAGETWILAGENLETGEFVRRVAALAGVPPPRRAPYALALAAARASGAAARLAGRRPRLPPDLVRASRLYTFASSAKAEADLGYRARPVEESIRDTLRWFLAAGRLAPATPELAALAGPA